jgi:hypothetical protein
VQLNGLDQATVGRLRQLDTNDDNETDNDVVGATAEGAEAEVE